MNSRRFRTLRSDKDFANVSIAYFLIPLVFWAAGIVAVVAGSGVSASVEAPMEVGQEQVARITAA